MKKLIKVIVVIIKYIAVIWLVTLLLRVSNLLLILPMALFIKNHLGEKKEYHVSLSKSLKWPNLWRSFIVGIMMNISYILLLTLPLWFQAEFSIPLIISLVLFTFFLYAFTTTFVNFQVIDENKTTKESFLWIVKEPIYNILSFLLTVMISFIFIIIVGEYFIYIFAVMIFLEFYFFKLFKRNNKHEKSSDK